MKFNGKLRALMMSVALLGMVAVTPITTNAASPENQEDQTIQPLHRGMHNSDVKPLQEQLKTFDYYHFHIDGIFGPLTFQAIKDFQKDNGLAADGIVGQSTKQKLQEMNALRQTYENAPLLKKGSKGEIVKDVQSQLKGLDYYRGRLDGLFGQLTKRAVIDFQKANDITIDGIVGPETYSALIHNPIRQSSVTESSAEKESSDKTVVESISTGPDNSKGSQASDDSNASVKTEANVTDVSQKTDNDHVDHDNVRTLYVESTAYTAHCAGCSGITATGINLLQNPGAKVIAVDPSVIPLGSKVWVEGYGYAIAGDTGGAINGRRIDVFISSRSKAMHWGRKRVKVKVFG